MVDSPATPDAAGEPADAELLARARRGDEEAFGALVHRHGRYLYGVARAIVQNDHDAEDAVQEAFAAAAAAGASYRGESSVRTWLVAILARQAALLRRKRARWWRRPEPGTSALLDPGPVPASDARLDLATMLARLSVEHREVIVLRELEGMSYEQIAAALHVPRGTVESRLHRAREHLRGLFAERDDDKTNDHKRNER